MATPKDRDLYQYLTFPRLQLQSPPADISPEQFERLKITVEDFRFVTREVTDDLTELPADIRSRATVLRRLLCEGDLFAAGKLLSPRAELRVTARMLDFEPACPTILISCGNYPWKGDRLPGLAAEFSIKDIAPLGRCTWAYREDADVSLSKYLEGLAISVLGTRIRRREVVKYVADKKAAHVSDRRKLPFEYAMDRAWSLLSITIVSSEGQKVSLNVAYLELLSVLDAMARSSSINEYVADLDAWLRTASPIIRKDDRVIGKGIPSIPIAPL